jgi:Fur family ferric uptake transcriptional regulator
MNDRRQDTAEHLVRAAGARVTQPRVGVLATLLDAPRALTHHEIVHQVRRALPIDRVTVYRVLEWLIANRLAHRIAGDDRVWRFNAVAGGHADAHAHFECNACGRVVCLEDVATPRRVALPAGYRSQHVQVTVKGLCAACSPPARGGRRTGRKDSL